MRKDHCHRYFLNPWIPHDPTIICWFGQRSTSVRRVSGPHPEALTRAALQVRGACPGWSGDGPEPGQKQGSPIIQDVHAAHKRTSKPMQTPMQTPTQTPSTKNHKDLKHSRFVFLHTWSDRGRNSPISPHTHTHKHTHTHQLHSAAAARATFLKVTILPMFATPWHAPNVFCRLEDAIHRRSKFQGPCVSGGKGPRGFHRCQFSPVANCAKLQFRN